MDQARSMMDIAPSISSILNLPVPKQAQGVPIMEMVGDFRTLKRVAVLALDALGLFAWNLLRKEMPYLSGLHDNKTLVLRSVMPSITPVNFTTMVTGNDQGGHGVGTFNDRIGCESLFDVVRQAGLKSAGVGLNGFTGSELLGRHADICGNAGDGSDDGVVDAILDIVERDRPDFIIAQFGRVDDYFHMYGPSSPDVVPMLPDTDVRLQKVIAHLKERDYAVIILADHGQHDVVDPEPGGFKGTHGTDRPEDLLVPCTWL